jgi:hypothetical protein
MEKCPAWASSILEKTLGESKRGADHQSTDPSRCTKAAP